jgi:heat shock protein HslJ
MKALTVMIAMIFTISLGSCDETKKVIDAAGNVQISGNYSVSKIDGKTIGSNKPTISFTALDKAVNGNTGCNSFFGKYSLDLYALSFSEIASTEMACDAHIMKTENDFLQALRNTGSYSLENEVLVLYSKNDRSILLEAQRVKNENN